MFVCTIEAAEVTFFYVQDSGDMNYMDFGVLKSMKLYVKLNLLKAQFSSHNNNIYIKIE